MYSVAETLLVGPIREARGLRVSGKAVTSGIG